MQMSMLRRVGIACLVVAATTLAGAGSASRGGASVEPIVVDDPTILVGTWEGALNVGAFKLRLRFNVEAKPDQPDEVSATLDSLDQNASGLKVDTVRFNAANREAVFEMPTLRSRFVGKLNTEGTELVGSWEQTGTLPITFQRVAKSTVIKRPQEPKPPFPYEVIEVAFWNEPADVTLAGTLTLPQGDGPFPAVVLVSGSGPQDRNESLFGHQPFAVLADHLARAGIASLRYDDRGVGKSTGVHAQADSRDFAADALAACRFLAQADRIDPTKLGLIGHSEGGLIGPLVAQADPKLLRFLILWAGPGVDGKTILLDQAKVVGRGMKTHEEELAASLTLNARLFDIILAEPNPAKAEPLLIQTIDEFVAQRPQEQRAAFIQQKAQVEATIKQINGPWFRFFLRHDPAPVLAELKIPVLALLGEKDTQVTPALHRPALERALAGNPEAVVEVIPGVNHLFQTAETGLPDEYARIEETICPAALERITHWIQERTR